MENINVISITDLMRHISKRWKQILITLMIGALLGGSYHALCANSANKAISSQENNWKEGVDETDISKVEAAHEVFAFSQEQARIEQDYLNTSLLMKADYTAVPTSTLIYSFSNSDSSLLNNSETYFETALLNTDTLEKIAASLSIPTEYVPELISITSNSSDSTKYPDGTYFMTTLPENSTSNLISLKVVADSEENCSIISDALKERCDSFAETVAAEFAGTEIRFINRAFTLTTDVSLKDFHAKELNLLNSYNSSIQNATYNLTDTQKALYETAYMTSAETEKTPLLSKKSILAGGIGLVLFYLLVVILKYCFSDTLRYYEDLRTQFKATVLGRPMKGCEDTERIARIATETALFAKQNDFSKVYLTGAANNETTKNVNQAIADSLRKANIEAEALPSILSDLNAVEKLNSSSGVVFTEQLFTTSYKDIESELELCARYNVPVIGFAVITE